MNQTPVDPKAPGDISTGPAPIDASGSDSGPGPGPGSGSAAPPPLGIIAGGGAVPLRLIAQCRAAGRSIIVAALTGHCPPATVEGIRHFWIRLGDAGRLFEEFHAAGVAELVMIGSVRKPSWSELRPDARGAAILARIGMRSFFGDDTLLKAVTAELEKEGFQVRGIQELMADLTAPEGLMGRHAPGDAHRADIARGLAVLRALGALDVGQAVVVQQGMVIGIEAIEGTDALIKRCGALQRGGAGGVLIKGRKPGQDSRLDLPTVGVATVEAAAAAGLSGLAVEAGGTLLTDRDGMIAAADAAGLFLLGIEETQQP